MYRHENLHKVAAAALLTLLCMFPLNIGFSQENTNRSPRYLEDQEEYLLVKTEEYGMDETVSIFIGFHDRRIYYVGQPVEVEFQIVNHGLEPYLFLTSYNKLFTFDFDIRTTDNRLVEHSKEYTLDTTRFEPILNDKIALKKDELYGVRIDISRWFDLQEPGEYLISGLFYPNLKTGLESDIRIESENEIYLYLNPPYTDELALKKREDEIRKLKAESLPPYQVVEVMLRALQERDYEKYFIYIKVDEFIKQFKNSYSKYQAVKDSQKPAVEEEFKAYLRGENELEELRFAEHIPHDFEIEKTVIEKKNALVTVKETFQYINLIEEKRYTYQLHLFNDKWLVYSYSIVNLP